MLRRVCKLLGFNPDSFVGADRKIIFDQGNAVPANDIAGYAVGCVFVHRDGGAATALYVNEGTESSCAFKALVTKGSPASAPTAAETTITNAGTASDYAIQALTNTSPYGFANQAEGETLVEVVLNNQARLNEAISALQSAGLMSS